MTGALTVGIYAHHHGQGHIQRCRSIKAALGELGVRAEILSTHPRADFSLIDDAGATDPPSTVTAGGTLHYAPLAHEGYRARMGQIARWIEVNKPDAFFVDVSVEVAAFVRLLGVPVVTLAMPGERADAPHQLGYAQASAIIAAWPSWVAVPGHLEGVVDKLAAVGGISRFDGRVTAKRRTPTRVTVMAGMGGSSWGERAWRDVEAACPGYEFNFLTGANRVEDPYELMARTGVMVIAAGQNSVADVAAASCPAIVLPQERPFGEQEATARVLRDAGLAVVPEGFPAPEKWPRLLEQARDMEPRWHEWETAGAARRAAEVIAGVALTRGGAA